MRSSSSIKLILCRRIRSLRLEQQSFNLEGGPEEEGVGGSSSNASNLTLPSSYGREESDSSIFDSTLGATLWYTQGVQNEIPLISPTVSPTCSLTAQSATAGAASEVPGSMPFDFIHEANALPNDGELLNEEGLQLWPRPHNGFPMSKEKLLAEISLFFVQGYAAYPLFHCETLMQKIHEETYLSNLECGTVVLSIAMLNEACILRRSPQHGQFTMQLLAKTIENRRNDVDGDHFSDNPSIDAVIVSLFLFISYNISENHNRAFYYLTEAIGLFDLLGEPSDPIETIRLQRLEYVLFITESATVSIYGSQRKRRISRRPSNPLEPANSLYWYNQEVKIEDCMDKVNRGMALIDRQAVDLLRLMARLHLATDISEVARITVDDKLMCSVSRNFGSAGEAQNLRYVPQTADVAITRQWKLAALWWSDMSHRSAWEPSNIAVNSTIEMIAMTTLAWSKTLEPGHLRIVGLGKVVALTDSILNISSKLGIVGSCTSLIRHLIQTVAETDYDQYFAPQLSMTEICIGNVPRSLFSNDESENFIYDTERGLIS